MTAMSSLDRRDRRRARTACLLIWPTLLKWKATKNNPVDVIAAALRREREETGLAAIGHLFAKRAQANARKAFEAKHGPVKAKARGGTR